MTTHVNHLNGAKTANTMLPAKFVLGCGLALALLVPLGVVTSTLAVPATPAGVTAVIEVELTKVTEVAAVPPMVTPVTPVKLVPVIVTDVPPAVVPDAGEIAVTVGAGVR